MNSLISYGFVGAFSAFVYFFSFSVCWNWFSLDYRIAVSIGYVLSVVTHFLMNRSFTFEHKGQDNLLRHMIRYSVMLTINYLLTLLIVNIVVSGLGFSPYIGIATSIALTMGTGYVMSRCWVFKPSL